MALVNKPKENKGSLGLLHQKPDISKITEATVKSRL